MNLNKNKFYLSSILIIVSNFLVGTLAYFFQIIIGRLLEPSEFVKFSVVISLLVLFNSPLTTVMTVTAKEVAHLRASHLNENIYYLYKLTRKLAVFNIVLLLFFYWFTSIYWFEYLKLDKPNLIIILFLLFFISPFCFINNGILQGIQSFKYYSIVSIVEVLLKIVICTILILIGFGLQGALIGVLLAMFFSQLVSYIYISNEIVCSNFTIIHTQSLIDIVKKYLKYWPLLFGNIALIIITQADILFVNRYFSIIDSSIYAVSSTLGKTIFYLPAGIVSVALPMYVSKFVKNENAQTQLLQSIFLSFSLCILIALTFWIFQDSLIPFLFGSKYSSHENLLGWYSISIIPISMAMVIESSMIAKGKFLYSWLYIIFSPIYIFLIIYFHHSIYSIILINGIIGFCILFIGIISLFYKEKRSV